MSAAPVTTKMKRIDSRRKKRGFVSGEKGKTGESWALKKKKRKNIVSKKAGQLLSKNQKKRQQPHDIEVRKRNTISWFLERECNHSIDPRKARVEKRQKVGKLGGASWEEGKRSLHLGGEGEWSERKSYVK